jgi:flagellar hook-basal body complex protein FliE
MNTIDANSLLLQMRALAVRSQGVSETAAPSADFRNMLVKALGEVNHTQQTARTLSDRFERGDPKVDLSEVMIAAQKANVSFQAITQVRNKLVAAYQDVMNMPI